MCSLGNSCRPFPPIALLGREVRRRGAPVILGPPKHTFGEPGVRGTEFRRVSFLGSDCPGRCRRLSCVKGARQISLVRQKTLLENRGCAGRNSLTFPFWAAIAIVAAGHYISPGVVGEISLVHQNTLLENHHQIGLRGTEVPVVSFLGSDCPGRCRRLSFVKGVRQISLVRQKTLLENHHKIGVRGTWVVREGSS